MMYLVTHGVFVNANSARNGPQRLKSLTRMVNVMDVGLYFFVYAESLRTNTIKCTTYYAGIKTLSNLCGGFTWVFS